MINRDGGLWRITWTRLSDGRLRAWVASHPEIAVEAETTNELDDAMVRAIDEQLQAGEWTADWHPPLPTDVNDGAALSSEYLTLIPDGRFNYLTDPDLLFEGGVCRGCGASCGPRTSVELAIHAEIPAGLMFGGYGGPSLEVLVAREETAATIGQERLAGAEVRPVRRVGRGRTKFVEIIPSRSLSAVARKGMDVFGGRCTQCQVPSFSERYGPSHYRSLFRRSEIPIGTPAFWVDDCGSQLCVSSAWWGEARAQRAFRGVISRGLWTIRDEDVDPDPPLKRHEWNRDQHARYLESQKWIRERYQLPSE